MEPWEIWVSESQERMMVSVLPENVDKVLEIFEFWGITANVVGKVIKEQKVILNWYGETIYDMDIEFTTGAVSYNRPYKELKPYEGQELEVPEPSDYNEALLKVISSYNIASKEWAIRQYDHVIRGNTVLCPMQGVYETPGPGDATIIRPVPGRHKGLAFTSDVNPRMVGVDPYWGAASSVEESFRNLVAIGARPHSMSDCLCFGNPEKEEIMGQFVAACEGLHFAADNFGVPFISGNVSFYNESEGTAILPTPTIMTVGLIDDVRKAVSMDLKGAGNALYIIGETDSELGGSEYFARVYPEQAPGKVVPRVYPDKFKAKMEFLFSAMDQNFILSCHDIAEGGLAVALAEMCFAGSFGANVDICHLPGKAERDDYRLFSESNGRWIVEVKNAADFEELARKHNIEFAKLGTTINAKKLKIGEIIDLPLEELHKAWKRPVYDVVGGE
jgi:phosphoribosylformylglycinamidine synthase